MARTLDVYGLGGYDPGKPNNNLISSTVIPDDPIVVNAATIRAKATAALEANATFQAITSPSQAQALAQVQLLTKEVNALIRLVLGLLDTVDDT